MPDHRQPKIGWTELLARSRRVGSATDQLLKVVDIISEAIEEADSASALSGLRQLKECIEGFRDDLDLEGTQLADTIEILRLRRDKAQLYMDLCKLLKQGGNMDDAPADEVRKVERKLQRDLDEANRQLEEITLASIAGLDPERE